MMCVNGLFVALELKKSDKETEDLLQTYKLDQINKAKGLGIKVSPESWPEVFKELTAISKGEPHDRNFSGTT